jgi:hypothetical protein
MGRPEDAGGAWGPEANVSDSPAAGVMARWATPPRTLSDALGRPVLRGWELTHVHHWTGEHAERR